MKPPAPHLAAGLGLAAFLLHLAANPQYGFFRDELYFIVCGRHPAFGYVDQPPIVPLLAAASQALGTSLFAIRAVAAAFAGASVWIACLLARDMGAGRLAMLLTGFSAALAPVLLAFGARLGPDTVQLFLWPAAILCAGRALQRSPAWWVAAGAALGGAGEAKYSAVIVAAALLAGVAATPQRKAFATGWFWAGIALAGLILLPNALWQWHAGWPMLELLRNGQHGKNVMLTPATFLLQQLLLTNPALSLIWLAGVAWCLMRTAWRWLGIGYLALMALMIVLHGKAYYPAAIYPALFAAGAVAIEAALAQRAALRRLAPGAVLLAGLPFLPMILPVLPGPQMAAYLGTLRRMGLGVPAMEHHRQAILGQDYADMHGWQELADQVSGLYAAQPEPLRETLRVFAANYGEAAALDVLGHGFPPTLSGHNQYWLWGPGDAATALLDVNGDLAADKTLCASATIVGMFSAPYVMPYEDDMPIILCQGLHPPLAQLWPKLKHYE